jgi:hypothetical protein
VRETRTAILLLLASSTAPAFGQTKHPPAPVETTVCKISDDPSAYNNRLVRVRGYIQASSEYSLFVDEHCVGNEIWLAFADGSAPPQVEAVTKRKRTAGGQESKRQQSPPIQVHLVKDASYTELMNYLAISAKGEACADGPRPALPPDCTSYHVSALFTGRVDGVSKQVHLDHFKHSSRNQIDGTGFGHMGMFDAQIVVQSAENVVRLSDIRSHPAVAGAAGY